MDCAGGVCFGVQLVFEDYLERVKEKEEKEAKKRRRLADDFTNLLRNTKVRVNGTRATPVGWICCIEEGVMVVLFVDEGVSDVRESCCFLFGEVGLCSCYQTGC